MKCSERAEETKLAIESAHRYKKEDDGIIEEKARMNLCEDQEIVSIYKTRFCKTCFISRPPLASHCRYCDQCVTKFDHHCFLVNTCVGRRNFRSFVFFTNTVLVLALLYNYSYINLITASLKFSSKTEYDPFVQNLSVLFVMCFPEIFVLYKLRPVSTLFAIYYLYLNPSLASLFYISTCFTLGCSLHYTLSYLYLIYQGYSKKELRAVEFET